MSDAYTPTAIANRALNAAGSDFFLGDIEEGSTPAQICLRVYSDCVRNLLRTAGWNFARKQAPMLCLADATGQTANVGTLVPGNQFLYSYAYPIDCQLVRYVPWYPFVNPGVPTNNITPSNSSSQIVDGLQNAVIGQRPVPARFLVTSDQNYIPQGASNSAPGIAPTGRTVILCNVPPTYAQLIYTYDAMYPNLWDHSFREAMIAYLASEIAVPIATDKKFGMMMRDQNIKIAMQKIKDARVNDGREGWHSSDLGVDWMRARITGRGWGAWGGAWLGNIGLGDFSCSYASIGFANGSAF